MNIEPLISIITPCFNGAKYLKAYFEGILNQNHKNIELIFVNDGSSDDTEKIALQYGEKLKTNGMCFKYIYQKNAGAAAALNRGLSCFEGEYLTRLDADDIMLPDNLSKKLEFLINNEEFGFVINGIQIVDENDLDRKIGSAKRIKPNGNDNFFEDLIYGHSVVWGPGTILVRRECILEAFPQLSIYESKEGQNWQMMLPLAYLYKTGYIDEELLKCVSHFDSHSRQNRRLEDWLKREQEFIVSCSETVKNIPKMSDSEKENYIKKIRVFHNRNKLDIATEYLSFKYYIQIKSMLIEDGYKLSFKEKIYIFARAIWHNIRGNK